MMAEASSPNDDCKDAEPTISTDSLQQDSTTLSQQQQQIDASQQSSSASSSIGVATNQATNQTASTSNTAATTNNKSDLSSMPEDLFSNKRWGTTPIRQDIPWDLPPSPTQSTPAVPALGGGVSGVGLSGMSGSSLAIPPGISQSGQSMAAAVGLVGGATSGGPSVSRFDQPWRPMTAIGSGFQAPGDFARAPGPVTSSLLDSKPYVGISQRASTWSSFGTQPGSNEPDSEWPKTTNSGISGGQTSSNAFDLAHDFDSAKSWHSAFSNAYGFSSSGPSKSPNGGQYEGSGIGTWSPVVKGNRSGSLWDGEGADGRGDNGRFDDGTAIWGNPTSTKAAGAEWGFEGGDTNNANDKSRSAGMNNQSSFRHQQQSSSSASLLMSSNTSPPGQHNRNPNVAMNKASSSHNFDQVQQQANALSGQTNQPNRGIGLSPNVPSKHQQQLTTMVQQIQLAVQAGHLNPQILNQPLAPVTLQLLYQLLTQIRSLHQLQMKFNQPGSHQAAFSVQMTKTKQNIMNLQNQIAAQQAMHLKQQQTQAHNISTRQPTISNLATGGVGSGNLGPTLPPGISQSGSSVGDFHSGQAIVNSFGVDSMGANGLASNLSHLSLGGGGQAGMIHSTRFDQPWRASASNKPHHPSMGATSSSFANHNLINAAPGGMQKSMLGGGGSSFGMQQSGGEFARAPGPASSIMDNSLAPKPTFGMTSTSASRTSSTWSAFGNSSSNDPESEWPKSTTTSSGISSSNTTANQSTSNAFDLVPEFEPGKPWRGSMLMRSVEDDPTMTPASMARSLAPQRKIWSDEIL